MMMTIAIDVAFLCLRDAGMLPISGSEEPVSIFIQPQPVS